MLCTTPACFSTVFDLLWSLLLKIPIFFSVLFIIQITQLKISNNELKGRVDTLEAELKSKADHLKMVESELKTKVDVLEMEVAENGELKAKVDLMKLEVNDLKMKNEVLKIENTQLKSINVSHCIIILCMTCCWIM